MLMKHKWESVCFLTWWEDLIVVILNGNDGRQMKHFLYAWSVVEQWVIWSFPQSMNLVELIGPLFLDFDLEFEAMKHNCYSYFLIRGHRVNNCQTTWTLITKWVCNGVKPVGFMVIQCIWLYYPKNILIRKKAVLIELERSFLLLFCWMLSI